MTSSGRAATEKERFQPSQFGAVGVIYGPGPDAELLAYKVREQCVERGVPVDVWTIDEFEPGDAPLFSIIVLIIRSDPSSWSPRIRRWFQDVIATYRRRRPDGLAAVIQGRQQPWHAGIVQILVLGSEREFRENPAFKLLRDQACVVRFLDDTGEPFDLYDFLAASTDGSATSSIANPAVQLADEVATLWTHANSWGVTTPQQVYDIVRLINNRRRHYDNPRFTATHRPFLHAYPDDEYPNKAELGLMFPYPEANQLDLVLDHPEARLPQLKILSDDEYKKKHDTFMIGGGRVARHTVDHVRQFHPDFRRPGGRDGTRDAQPALYRIYSTLVALQRNLDTQGDETTIHDHQV